MLKKSGLLVNRLLSVSTVAFGGLGPTLCFPFVGLVQELSTMLLQCLFITVQFVMIFVMFVFLQSAVCKITRHKATSSDHTSSRLGSSLIRGDLRKGRHQQCNHGQGWGWEVPNNPRELSAKPGTYINQGKPQTKPLLM